MIRHAGIVVDDLNRSIRFYKQLGFILEQKHKVTEPLESIFGKDVLDDGFTQLTWVKLKCSPPSQCSTMIELYYFGELYITNICNGYNHIAITVTDVTQHYNRLKRAKYQGLRAEIKENEKVKMLMVRDPDGNLLELVEEKHAK